MKIVLDFDGTAQRAPAGYDAAIQAAANLLDAAITNNITVTIGVGYGSYEGTPLAAGVLGESAPVGTSVTYTQLVAAYRAAATSATDVQFLDNLPSADPSGGGTFFLSNSQQKALGLISGASAGVDGYAGFSSTLPFDYNDADGITPGTYDLEGIALHELTHAMGRYLPPAGMAAMNLMTYGSNGQLNLNNGTSRYLSLNGGLTNLANMDTTSDPGDFASGTPTDPFDSYLSAGTPYAWTPLDATIMDALGFNVGAAAAGAASPNGTVVLPGGGGITDANGDTWSISSGMQVVVDGGIDPTTSAVVQLENVNGRIWQLTSSGTWWSKAMPHDSWSGPVSTAPLAGPSISGTSASQTVPAGASLTPFRTVAISDGVANASDSATILLTGTGADATDAGGTLSGTGLTKASAGTYTLAATSPAGLTSLLQQLVFTPAADASAGTVTHLSLAVTDHALSVAGGANALDQATSILQQPAPAPSTGFMISDQTTGATWQSSGTAYTGPVAGLATEMILPTTDNINVVSNLPNVFIHTGSGMDGLTATSGNNILDGSTGSNFLIGGTGSDTFYMDDRNPVTPIFSTIVNFHAGDNATVWGVNQSDFHITVLDNQGATGATGVDLVFSAPGHVDTSFVLAGYTSADLSNGKLSLAYGKTQDLPGLPGSLYMTLHANG